MDMKIGQIMSNQRRTQIAATAQSLYENKKTNLTTPSYVICLVKVIKLHLNNIYVYRYSNVFCNKHHASYNNYTVM